MAINTANFDLELPEDDDFYSIHVQNGNMRKIDVAIQENKDKINNHENKTSEHLTTDQVEKIENAIQPLENFTSGNFVQINSDGTFSDSGLNKDSFSDGTDSEHRKSSIYSEKGEHNLRYHNQKFQLFDGTNWIDVTEKSFIQVKVNVSAGSSVTATDGITTLTGTSVNGVCTFTIPNFGTWTFTATLNAETSKPVQLVIDTVKLYTITLQYFYVKFAIKSNKDLSNKILYVKFPEESTYREYNSPINLVIESTKRGSYEFYLKDSSNTLPDTEIIQMTIDNSHNEQTITVNLNYYYNSIQIKMASHVSYLSLVELYSNNQSLRFTRYDISKISDGLFKISFYWKRKEQIFVSVEAKYSSNDHDSTRYPTVYDFTDTINITNSEQTFNIECPYKIYGFTIEQHNTATSNPSDRVKYVLDASNMTAGSSNWNNTEIFSKIEPYVVAPSVTGGTVKVNKNDFSYTESGAKITDLYANKEYDIMVKFPKLYYSIFEDGGKMHFLISDTYFPSSSVINSSGTKTFNSRCIGTYLIYTESNNRAYSRSSKSPTDNQSLNTVQQQIANKGSNYRMFNYEDFLILQTLFILRYKSTDSESALGRGFVSGESKAFTGRLDQKGMYSGSSTSGASMDGIKFCGLEDFWGNLFCYIDGLSFTSDGKLKSSQGTQSLSFTSFANYFVKSLGSLYPFIQSPSDTRTGSSSTYFCDYQYLVKPSTGENIAYFGSVFNGGYGMGGLFSLWIDRTADNMPSSGRGARIVYEGDV